jgi:hypothetical protein
VDTATSQSKPSLLNALKNINHLTLRDIVEMSATWFGQIQPILAVLC